MAEARKCDRCECYFDISKEKQSDYLLECHKLDGGRYTVIGDFDMRPVCRDDFHDWMSKYR